ncbi:MAG: TetR/AcrR family transcriptional regulator [Proteobacteria bacterium]|nr:TetR/AcrR family transcriptional regulator [Pseudomonadota bacterium]
MKKSSTAMSARSDDRRRSSVRRANNRQQDVLDQAAKLFGQSGYDGTSMRDVANAVGMLHGSLYYHYPSKEDLFLAVYAEGKRRNDALFADALDGIDDPWDRLEAVCVAHIQASRDESAYSLVLRQHILSANGEFRRRLVAMRDSHEDLFRRLIEALPLPRSVDRKYFRLLLLGGLMHAPVWYRPGGDPPKTVVRAFLALLGRPK